MPPGNGRMSKIVDVPVYRWGCRGARTAGSHRAGGCYSSAVRRALFFRRTTDQGEARQGRDRAGLLKRVEIDPLVAAAAIGMFTDQA